MITMFQYIYIYMNIYIEIYDAKGKKKLTGFVVARWRRFQLRLECRVSHLEPLVFHFSELNLEFVFNMTQFKVFSQHIDVYFVALN